MVKPYTFRIQSFPRTRSFYLIFSLIFWCPLLWASQDAIVITERAVVYADREMTSPIGYINRGKKIVVGEVARNKAQVYPIIVSGKLAYIRVLDISTEKESMDSTRLTAERFQKATSVIHESKFVGSYYSFFSKIQQSKQNGKIKDNDALFWNGASLKGEILVKRRLDIQIIANYMGTQAKEETYKVFEFGAGAALRLLDHRRFLARLEGQFLAVPFSSYELGGEYRVRSFGFTTGGGLNLSWFFDKNWAMEVTGGLYYTKLLAFDSPDPYADFSASFVGARTGIGLNYTY
jgi:hypothetical protein